MAVSVATRASSRRNSVVELMVVAAAAGDDDDVGGDDVEFVLFDVGDDDVADVAAVVDLLTFYFSSI